MSQDDHLGEFEHLVLLAILRLGDDAYGVSIRQALAEVAGRTVSYGAVYSTLRRLLSKGYVSAREGDPEPVQGGRAKRFFAVEKDGLNALRRSHLQRRNLTVGLEEVLEDEGG